MAEIQLDKVTKIYGKNPGVLAVDRLDLEIRDREFLVLLGPSGCGKSSMLRMIAGLEEATSGDIRFDGKRVNDLSPSSRDIAMAFESYALYPLMSVYDNIAFPLQVRKIPETAIKQRVEWAAQKLQISDILDRRPAQISGGHQQRVSLARAIVREPRAFLLDEPLSHLDIQQKQFLRIELKRLHSDLQTTMICVTHDQKEAMALADRIAVMNDGKLLQIGSPDEIYNDPTNLFVAQFVGEPAMNFLDCELISGEDCYKLTLDDETVVVELQEASVILERGTLCVGIRPRNLELNSVNSCGLAIPATVQIYESIGERGILTVTLNGKQVKVLTEPGRSFNTGEEIRITFPAQSLYIFDPKTGERDRELESFCSNGTGE
jgi:multiple sugar transport system ATP-binding protein